MRGGEGEIRKRQGDRPGLWQLYLVDLGKHLPFFFLRLISRFEFEGTPKAFGALCECQYLRWDTKENALSVLPYTGAYFIK